MIVIFNFIFSTWLANLQSELRRLEQLCERDLLDCINSVKEVRMLQDRELIANKLVVGMTTTKAAAMQPLLKSLKPSIGE